MIKNRKTLLTFEDKLIRESKPDILKNFRIVDAMYDEAVALGIFPLKDPLDGLKIDIRIAKVVNHV